MSTVNQELAVIPEQAIAPKTPMDLMQQAIMQGLSVEQLQVIQQMYYAQQDRDAKHAYDAAMLEFKKNPPVIRKTKPVTYEKGPNAKPAFYYAPLEEVCPVIIAELNKYGITHKWRTDPPANPGWVRVTCILTHELGHREENGLEAPVDPSGGKNAIQAVISTTHYLERVTLLSACGLAAKGLDDDGQGAGPINNGWLSEQVKKFNECGDQQYLQQLFTAAFNEAKKNRAAQAMLALVEARDKRKAELG